MTGFRTCILAVDVPNSLASESLQTDISPVCPSLLSSYLPGLLNSPQLAFRPYSSEFIVGELRRTDQ
jgi:hypothetical protein